MQIVKPKFISPTSLHMFEWSRVEWALKYLVKRPRKPATLAMSLGSGVDAFIKSYLHPRYNDYDPEYQLVTLFNTQVDEQHREDIWPISGWINDRYQDSGLLTELDDELSQSIVPPRFEFKIETEVAGVPILGYPDLYFINPEGVKCIYDFKVNGYFSASRTSPIKGYLDCYDTRSGERVAHKKAEPVNFKGTTINSSFLFEECNKKWADQLAMYGWISGIEPGSMNHVIGIEQFVGREEDFRICKNRCQIGHDYQMKLVDRLVNMWDAIQNDNVVTDDELDLMVGQDEIQKELDLM